MPGGNQLNRRAHPVRVGATVIRMKRLTLWLATAMVAAVSIGDANGQATDVVPNFRVQVFGSIAADFSDRVDKYAALRATLEQGLPPLTLTDDPTEITRAEEALAERLRAARPNAKQGELFTREVRDDFRRVLLLEVDAETMIALMDDNPGAFSVKINASYSKNRSLSTVPANILALLPRLPDDLQYRFLGPHLVLHDTRANVIVDRLPCAIRCSDD